MKLKSVELIGFKSFAKKTKIDFPAGITEIVGPNGSGKSNIIEAIRWALGEQSAKNLRSSRMTDVIFSGSQSHAALNRAKVTLVFDNGDHFLDVKYDEVTVSRTVFRDGTNNYYLNGEPCRLRDVQDLFMNTGIGNGSFSIISQGRVAQIFKSKPVDRRFIIETVAGIYKYRSQKEIAAKKLSHVNDNLTRINDLTYELKHQLDSLSKQRKVAKQYLAQKHLATHLDVNRLYVRFNQLQQKLRLSKARSHKASSSVTILKQRITKFQKAINQVHWRLDRSLKGYNHLQEQILANSQRLDTLTSQSSLSRQKLSFWRQQISRCQATLAKDHQKVHKLRSNQKNLKNKKLSITNKMTKINQKVSRFKSKRFPNVLYQHRLNINRLRSDYVDLVKRSAQIKGQINNLHQNRQQYYLQAEHSKSQLKKVQTLIDQTKSSLNVIKHNVMTLKQSASKLNNDHADLEDQYQHISRQFQTVRSRYHGHERQRQISQIKLNGLKRINARHSNLYNGTRNLLNHKDRFPGVLGTVAKYIDVSDTYVQAIETTLRSQLQQIIVDDPETAREIVNFMSDRRLGRVTLLPVNAISRRGINPLIIESCQKVPGFINVASNLVKMPPKLLDVKLHLLGNVLVTNNISVAIQVSRIVHRRYRVVTLNGNVINSGGAITGGRGHYHYHGLLSQKVKAEQSRQSVVHLNQTIEQDRNNGLSLSRRLVSIKSHLQTINEHSAKKRQQLAIKANLKTRLFTELQNYQNILNQRQKSLNTNDNHAELKTLQSKYNQVEKQVSDIDQDLKSEKQVLNHQLTVAQQYGQQHQESREKLIKIVDQKGRLEQDIKINLDHSKQLSRNIDDNQREVDKFTHAIDNQSQRVQSNQTLEKLSKEIDQLTAQKVYIYRLVDQNRSSLKRLEAQSSKLQNQLIASRNRANQVRLNIHDLDHRLHEVTETLFRKYQINISKVKVPKPDLGLYQISSKLYRVQKQLRQIGPVNVNSINQFDKVNHRYRFLSDQINDLITSKKQLATTMDQMDSKIKIRFENTFDQVNQAFKVTYSQIFRGGKAKLTLIDPKHLLTTGINIMAQPPGKRYRNMELLSGGERALTAIALLFAILKIKPAPFCILDEAESALDAVNIDRFGKYMQRLKARTQFIVITHRKTTMLYADNLYGVTMQDSGISKIISVNLSKAKTKG